MENKTCWWLDPRYVSGHDEIRTSCRDNKGLGRGKIHGKSAKGFEYCPWCGGKIVWVCDDCKDEEEK